ncbi:6-hydroxymethylpterin diphosphokinase MptE-like protein [Halothiobacillus sp.]|uniref:6-hydroxymethylpterin diphosphokinase MptE-like protein n=1 Tax=Halothiobacillus sp. TaxID=1891311 RepID=UPI003D14A294
MSTTNQNTPSPRFLPTEDHFELIQTAFGDWIFPELNALHFAAPHPDAFQHGNQKSKSHALNVLSGYFNGHLHAQDRLYIIIGSDSGQLIKYVQTLDPLPRGSRWLFIEPEPYARILQQTPAISDLLDDYVHLATPETWEETANQLLIDDYFRIGGVIFERSLAAFDHPTSTYLSLVDTLDAQLTQRRYAVVANMGNEPFIAAQIANAVNFYHDCSGIKNIFEGKKAIILAGGPSLDSQIDWIKAHRQQLFLIAVSRISARLQAASIQPDMVVTVDPFPISLTVSRQMFDFDHRCILVASNHAYPGIVSRWPHRLLYTNTLLPWIEKKPEDSQDSWVPLNPTQNLNSVGPTVTHTCVVLAAYLGFKEIAFAGLDLCHSPEGLTHASGSSEASAGPLLDFSAIKVTTNLGHLAWTTPDYFGGIGALENLARLLGSQGVKLFNPSPNAVAIKGVAFTPLEAIDWPIVPFDRSALDTAIKSTTAERIAHLERLKTTYRKMADDVRSVEQLAHLGIEANRAFFHGVNPKRQQMHNRRMRAIDRLLRRRYPEAESLVKAMAKRNILAADLPHDFFALDAKQAERMGFKFYASLTTAAKTLHPIFEQTLNRLETRVAELDRSLIIDEILERYIKFDEPERALWLAINWHLDPASVLKAEKIYAQNLEKQIEDNLKANQEKRHPKASLRLAEMHFSQQNNAALEALIRALANHPDEEQAGPYWNYLQGLHAELKHNPAQAMEHYEQVITTAEPERDALLLEHCLLRVSSISLLVGNHIQANQALGTAAQLNPNHWKIAGHLAELRGDMPHAIEIYIKHLQLFPGDSSLIYRLAHLFKNSGSVEGIRECLSLVDFCTPAQQEQLREKLSSMISEMTKSSTSNPN